ncbi:hypothetical protein ACFYS8_06750 [Kitasatospora sp. NPDC004615]
MTDRADLLLHLLHLLHLLDPWPGAGTPPPGPAPPGHRASSALLPCRF